MKHLGATIGQFRESIPKAAATILSGLCKRVDVSDDIKVYEVKNVLRIDIKIKED